MPQTFLLPETLSEFFFPRGRKESISSNMLHLTVKRKKWEKKEKKENISMTVLSFTYSNKFPTQMMTVKLNSI